MDRVLGRLLLTLLWLGVWTDVQAGPNANTTFVLHAVAAQYGGCDIPDPCALAGPNVEIVHPGQPHVIYFIVRNYAAIAGFQADLAWPSDWTWLFEISGCPPGALDCFHVSKHTISCVFNCITGGATVVMAAIHMVPGSGCFEIVESVSPGGTYVMNCGLGELESIPKSNWGRVCVGPGGINTCDPVVPVGSATWGAIKATY